MGGQNAVGIFCLSDFCSDSWVVQRKLPASTRSQPSTNQFKIMEHVYVYTITQHL